MVTRRREMIDRMMRDAEPRAMSPDFVRNTLARKPFRPFRIHLAGGRSIWVPSAEFVMMPEEGRLVVVEVPDGPTHVIDLLLVTDFEFPQACER
jgi:hypothetical protein